MLVEFNVFTEVFNRWPAKGTRQAGESFNLLLLDATLPSKYALRAMYEYRLSDQEKQKHWGKLEGKKIRVAVTEIVSGNRQPILRGEIVSAPEK